MKPMYSDQAEAFTCPFTKTAHESTCCEGYTCLAWEEVPDTDGMGICTRLSRRRVIQQLTGHTFGIIACDICDDTDESEVL